MRVPSKTWGRRARAGGRPPVHRAWSWILAASLVATLLPAGRALGGGIEEEQDAQIAGASTAPSASAAGGPKPVEHSIEITVEGAGATGEAALPVDAAAPAEGPVAPATAGEATRPVTAASATSAEDDALELELDDRPISFPDPFEGINRRTLSLNQTVDRWVLDPVTDAYVYVVPDRAKRSVRDFFANLESPAILVNDVLQGEILNAATTVARFSVNTVFGLAGFFDPATDMGLERHDADFGQTLARTGFGSGPFLIVPLLGPTTVRDGIGTLVDIAMQPAIYLLGPTPLVVASVQEGTEGLTLRAQHGDDLKRLEQGSLDYYAALRSAYYQDRMATLGELAVSEEATASVGSAAETDGESSPARAVASTPRPDDPT